MNNPTKEKRQTLIQAAAEANPVFNPGKRRGFCLVAAFTALITVFEAVQVIGYLVRGYPFSPSDTMVMLFPVLTALFWSLMIYNGGFKVGAHLCIIGGFYSLINAAYKSNLPANLTTPDMLVNFINLSLIVVVLAQIIIMAFIATDKKCGVYFSAMLDIQKEMTEYIKNNRP